MRLGHATHVVVTTSLNLENQMNKYQAHSLLNQVKMNMYFSPSQVNEALFITGDLDVRNIAPTVDKPLCRYGPESRYLRTGEASCFSTGELRVRTVGGNSNANQGEDR